MPCRKVAFETMGRLDKTASRGRLPTVPGTGSSSLGSVSDKNGSEEERLRPRQCYMERQVSAKASLRKMSGDSGLRAHGSRMLETLHVKSTKGWNRQRLLGLVMTPGGRSRAVWDALRMICVVVDIIVIPLSFFDLPMNEVQVSLSAFTLVFWTSDIFVSFRTGYFEKGTLASWIKGYAAIVCYSML